MKTVAAAFLVALAAAAAVPVTATAQGPTVLLHEVRADAQERWIELHNRGALEVDLSTWSLHFVSRTPGLPQTYWWAFPPSARIAAGGYLRVFWYQQEPAQPQPYELWTGATVFHFLFGLGGEPLNGQLGALALVRSQQNAQMNSANLLEDWVSFGGSDFPREALAVQAGLWTAGRAAPAIPAGHSLARTTASVGTLASPADEWFLDASPTPLGGNGSGGSARSYGAPCAVLGHHLLAAPELDALSAPVLGNPAFALTVRGTTGLFGEAVLVVFAAQQAHPSAPSLLPAPAAGPVCRELIDPTSLLGVVWLAAGAGRTDLSLPLGAASPALAGLHVHVQALVVDAWATYPPFQGTTNALELVLGS